jgi:hypothetical protein
LNRIFASTLNRRKQRAAKGQSGPRDESSRPVPDDASRLEQARLAVVDYLSHFPPQKRPSVMFGALASVYGQEKVVMDTAVWLLSSFVVGTCIETGPSFACRKMAASWWTQRRNTWSLLLVQQPVEFLDFGQRLFFVGNQQASGQPQGYQLGAQDVTVPLNAEV